MDNLINKVKQICQAYDLRPQHDRGQNFLINRDVLNNIVQAAEISPDDVILEIGPGLGILTEELVKKAKKVISVELDKHFFSFLQTKFAGTSNLELVNADILKFNPTTYNLQPKSYKIVANLPYNITSIFLKKFLTAQIRPAEMTILVQKEVANRVCAKAGDMSLLSISVQLYGEPKIIEVVPANCFWPKPKVESAILKITKIKNQAEVDNFLGGVSEKKFWQTAKIGFASRRKQLHNNLASGFHLSTVEVKKRLKKANFDPMIRPQNLTVSDWLLLAKSFDL